MKIDGSHRTQVNNHESMFINVVDNWIYYICDDRQLNKVGTDGKSFTCLIDDEASEYINVKGNWIYYKNISHGLNYKVKTDGSECTQLDGENIMSSFINVLDNWVYYLGYGFPFEEQKIVKMRTDGSQWQVVY